MSEQEILEGNRLIADFMQVDYSGKEQFMWRPGAYIPFTEKCLRYHLSWDWLMQVVEKIENLHEITNGFGFLFQIDNWSVNIKNLFTGEFVVHNNPKTCRLHSKFESVYKSTVEFIKWYNNQIK